MIGRSGGFSALTALALTGLAGGWVACSSSMPPPASDSSGGSGDAGTHDGASSADSGGGADASSDGATHDGGGPEEAGDAEAGTPSDAQGAVDGGDGGVPVEAGDGGGFPPPPNAVCSPTAAWGSGVLLSVSTPSDDGLDAITPDELTIAWTEGDGSTATLEYSDRATTTASFGAPQGVAAGSFSTARAALSHDGLHLVVVNADGQGFSEMVRTSRTSPGNTFGAPGAGSYANFAGVLPAGESYGDPVLAADDNAFYYSVYGDGLTATIFRAARLLPTDPFPTGAALTATSGLTAQGSLRRQPTAISSDEQTLFIWDQVLGTERMAFIDESTGAFDNFVDLGARAMAAPNTSCTNLYYSAQGASSVDLFITTN